MKKRLIRIFAMMGCTIMFTTACATSFHVPKIQDMPDRSIGSIDYGPAEPVKAPEERH